MLSRTASRVLLAVALLACTGAPPKSGSPPPGAATAPGTPVPEARMPLAFVVHPTRPPTDLSAEVAAGLLAGTVRDWRALGEPPGLLAIVAGPGAANRAAASIERAQSDAAAVGRIERDRGALAIVPAAAVSPAARALAVAGKHPLRDAQAYPFLLEGPAPPAAVTVLVAGDVMLARRVGDVLDRGGDHSAVLRHVARRLSAADVAVVNLECTLSRDGRPTQGADSFGANPRTIEGLRRAKIDVVSLANNHTGDFGPLALTRTVDLLRDAGFATTGAGRDDAAAREPAIVERNGVRVGFLAFNAIGETPAAAVGRPGAVRLRMQPRLGPLNREDLDRVLADVRALAARVHAVVVYPHWGANYTRRVHPDQRTVARALINAGADVVVGTHPHWVGGLERYRRGMIAYSLGNFVFDMDFSLETMLGVALEATFWGGVLKAVELLPLRIGNDFAPRFLSWAQGRPVLERAWRASRAPFNASS